MPLVGIWQICGQVGFKLISHKSFGEQLISSPEASPITVPLLLVIDFVSKDSTFNCTTCKLNFFIRIIKPYNHRYKYHKNAYKYVHLNYN